MILQQCKRHRRGARSLATAWRPTYAEIRAITTYTTSC